MGDESKLKLKETKREYVFREIQILYDLSRKVLKDQTKISSFKCRYKRIDAVREEYLCITDEINLLKHSLDPTCSIGMQAVETFDTMYYAILEVADALLPQPGTSTVVPGQDGSPSDHLNKPYSHVRLPRIELIKFDGNIEQWQTFYDTFVSLVHGNNDITNIEKFHYLLSCLTGSALSIAKGIPVTSDNYQIVFAALVDRYQNKRILAVNYLEKICNYSTLKTCSVLELREFTSVLQESVNALKSVNIENLGEFILFYLSSRKLDADTRKRFELQNNSQIPSFSELLTFLQGYIKVLEASEPSCSVIHKTTQSYTRKQNIKHHTSSSFPAQCELDNSTSYSDAGCGLRTATAQPFTQSDNVNTTRSSADVHNVYAASSRNTYCYSCVCCGDSQHTIYKCPAFHAKTLNDKEALINNKKLCYNCLRSNHTSDKCFSKLFCAKCSGRHHTLLHRDQSVTAAHPSVSLTTPEYQGAAAGVSLSATNTCNNYEHGRSFVLLGTCVVRARGPNGVYNIRALIDSGAQDCFVTSSCAQRLGLPLRRCNINVAGLGQNTVHEINGITSFKIQSQYSDEPCYDLQAIVMKTISHKMPSVEISNTIKDKYKHLILADNNFDKSADIDLLIGAELFHNIYDGQKLDVGPGLPVALHSVFGWVITGKLDPECRPPTSTAAFVASTLALDSVVKRFWEVEEPPKLKLINPENKKCEQMYTELVKRKEDGRYIVPMLLKEDREELGNSFHGSLNRFYRLEKRLGQNEQLKSDYVEFMTEYEDMNHMKLVESSDTKSRYIIPHHCVLRPDSATTKLRVVFDASAKTTNGVSLNNMVYTGPKLQNDIVDIITKFRLHKIVFTADISKMYRNIELRPEDRKYQHILWRKSPDEELRKFELNTVTYGVSSSPYLAIRTLQQLAHDHGDKWPQAAAILCEDTFMDDIVAGAPSVKEAITLKTQLIHLLNCAKFELRKWSSNSCEFLKQLPSAHCQTPKTFCDESSQPTLKILGMQWDPTEDVFKYSQSKLNLKHTKRAILSNIARIYDPLGWLTPLVLKAKLVLQELWRLRLTWDEPVPEDVIKLWMCFINELSYLNEIKIPRHAVLCDSTVYDLIGFCDGSSKAYGCCVYLKTINNGTVAVNLLIAKSRVAPIKPLTINRLELLGAVLLARVLKHMSELLQSQHKRVGVTAFSDSSTVLAWLNTEPYKLKTFVAHRVVSITDEIDRKNWYHVSTHDNPADHCSRGLSCSQLIYTSEWWNGPAWLASDSSTWPIIETAHTFETLPEMKTLPNVAHTVGEFSIPDDDPVEKLLTNCSSFSKVQRSLAWCLRFNSNARSQCKRRGGLSTDELESALTLLVRHEQTKSLSNEFNFLKCQKPCSRPIQKLNPFLDRLGLMRVGGRLSNSQLPLSAIYPLLLPKHSHLSNLIIDYYHRLHLHCGPRTLQSLIQRKFWILGIRNMIRSRLSKCVTCFRANPTPITPIMGNLPAPRVQASRCFQNIGIDFAGPFVIKESKRRKAATYKVYICVMVCLAVKAIHLELVTDLSTPAFIAALDRFASRRGLCNLIISDCGTNFIGAKRYLNEVQQFLLKMPANLFNEFSKRNIKWMHNPPTASHFGGIFESGVKSLKYHLKRVVGLQILTFEELLTVINKTEAVLNSRPLCALSSDPAEVDVLTPGHFLTGGPLVSLPEPPLTDNYIPPRERWQMLQKLTQSFWKVWHTDYLHTMQQRCKWFKGQANPRVGDVVTIVEQNLPPLEWRFGRVIELHPGSDGVVRVVTLRTAKGLLRRPVAKICPLPIGQSLNDEH